MTKTPNSVEDLMQIALEDPRYIIERGFWVINKDKKVVPFIFNPAQNMFYDNRTTRDDIVKGGQMGFTTMFAAIWTVKFLLVPNAWCVQISYESEATKRLFERVQFFLSHLPDWLQPFYKPGVESSSSISNEVVNSRFYIGTAGSKAFGRGDTIHYFHGSEVSRWDGEGRLFTNIIRAMPLNDPNTWAVKESTANGQGNWHHTEWQREKMGLSEFTPHFIPYFKDPTYRVEGAVLEDKSEEELRYQRRFPEITDEVLAWRRKMIGSMSSEAGRTPEEMFKQEFPTDDQEAFLFSGNPVFPVEQMQRYKEKVKRPIIQGNLVGIPPNQVLDEYDKGPLKIWEMPSMGGQYIIFADTTQYNDFAVAVVLDRRSWEVVAKLRARIPAMQFGDELNKLGRFYNEALIAVEVNNMGQSTQDRLITLEYPNMYMRERTDTIDKKISNVYGWLTTSKTKSQMVGYLQDLIRTEQAKIADEDIIDEMITFILHEDGTMAASEGNYDDCVIAVAGAYYVLRQHPFVETAQYNPVMAERARKFRDFRSGKKKRLHYYPG